MKDNISKLAKARNDDWGRAIVERLEQINDLVAADAQHHNSCMKKLYQEPTIVNIKKRGPLHLLFLEQNSEECQFICANCHGTCNNSDVDPQESDEDEDTETVSQQTFDEIEEKGDEVEEDNPIGEDFEQLPIHEVLLSPEDQELAKPGPSGIAKRRRMH